MAEKRLRLALVTTHPPGTGSLNEYAYHFIRYLRFKPEIAEIILLADELPPGPTYAFDDVGAPVRVLPCWRFNRLDNAWRILQAVRQARPDAVWLNLQFATFGDNKVAASLGLLAPLLLRLTRVPTIALLHNIMETVDLKSAGFGANPLAEFVIRTAGTLVTRALLSADLVALTIPKYVEILKQKYGADNVILTPHGSFDDSPPPTYALPPGPLQIMAFGKFGTYKRLETLIEAFRLLQDGNRPPLELVIAGTSSPNAPGYIEDLAAQLRDEHNVRFTGYVAEENVPVIFGEAAVVVFPYTSTTGSSGVLHQAGDYGKAVVLPNIGDFAEVITEEGYTGEFFAPGDAAELAAAIGRVLDDPERRRAIGAQNYMASRGLAISEVIDWYLLHFQALCRQR